MEKKGSVKRGESTKKGDRRVLVPREMAATARINSTFACAAEGSSCELLDVDTVHTLRSEQRMQWAMRTHGLDSREL